MLYIYQCKWSRVNLFNVLFGCEKYDAQDIQAALEFVYTLTFIVNSLLSCKVYFLIKYNPISYKMLSSILLLLLLQIQFKPEIKETYIV